jgi:hypothetical protein
VCLRHVAEYELRAFAADQSKDAADRAQGGSWVAEPTGIDDLDLDPCCSEAIDERSSFEAQDHRGDACLVAVLHEPRHHFLLTSLDGRRSDHENPYQAHVALMDYL